MTKEERNAKAREWYKANKEQVKSKKKDYYKTHIEQQKLYKIAHKEERNAYQKAYYQTHKEKHKVIVKAWQEAHRQEINEHARVYYKNDKNSHGKSKGIIRMKSQYILKKSGIKIPGYQIHHCFTYNDPSKFIYCSKETHLKIHQYLRDNNIDADSDHYEQIKHLLDENVVVFGV